MSLLNSYVPRVEITKFQTEFPAEKITSSVVAADFMRKFYFDDIFVFESSFILLLNQNNLTIGWAKISQGGISGTVIDPRLVAHYAIQSLAVGVIICHNHPSGNLQPSEADKKLTEKLKTGLSLLDITLLDHIILTGAAYYSFADSGVL